MSPSSPHIWPSNLENLFDYFIIYYFIIQFLIQFSIFTFFFLSFFFFSEFSFLQVRFRHCPFSPDFSLPPPFPILSVTPQIVVSRFLFFLSLLLCSSPQSLLDYLFDQSYLNCLRITPIPIDLPSQSGCLIDLSSGPLRQNRPRSSFQNVPS